MRRSGVAPIGVAALAHVRPDRHDDRVSRAIRRASIIIGLVVCAVSACAKDDEPEELPDGDVAGRDANPDGVPYPADRHGGKPRGASGRPGDRMPNFTFRGYVDGDRSRGLSTISMADYFDPSQKRHKVLHVQVAATWCALCSPTIKATTENEPALNARGIVFLEVILSGKQAGFGPSLEEVDGWIAQHGSTIDTAMDVRGRRLRGIGIDPLVMPHDILIDTRTMEILDSSPGTPLDVGAYGRDGVSWVTTHPPSY